MTPGKMRFVAFMILCMPVFPFQAYSQNTTFNNSVSAYEIPEKTSDGWETGSIYESCQKPETVLDFVKRIETIKYGKVDGFLIIKNNCLIYENYWNGYSKETIHFLSSGTKSISSLIIGAAHERGYLPDLDESVFTYLPEYTNFAKGRTGLLTIRHLLQMKAGFKTQGNRFNPNEDFFRQVLRRDNMYSPGEKFEYDNMLPNLYAGIIKYASGMHIDEFAKEYFFKALGIHEFDWNLDKWNGYPICQGTLQLRPRDQAKIGQLFISKGTWNGKRVLSQKWITDTMTPCSVADARLNIKYGYTWWIAEVKASNELLQVIYSGGSGGQFIFTCPQKNSVVVFTGSNFGSNIHYSLMRDYFTQLLPAL